LGHDRWPGSAQRENAGAGEKRKDGPPLQAELWAAGGKRPGKKVNSFSFSFSNFSKLFSKDFQIKFEFDLNHSIQNFKCSSMNAQSCFYPYI
jgi:hypothetical protein